MRVVIVINGAKHGSMQPCSASCYCTSPSQHHIQPLMHLTTQRRALGPPLLRCKRQGMATTQWKALGMYMLVYFAGTDSHEDNKVQQQHPVCQFCDVKPLLAFGYAISTSHEVEKQRSFLLQRALNAATNFAA